MCALAVDMQVVEKWVEKFYHWRSLITVLSWTVAVLIFHDHILEKKGYVLIYCLWVIFNFQDLPRLVSADRRRHCVFCPRSLCCLERRAESACCTSHVPSWKIGRGVVLFDFWVNLIWDVKIRKSKLDLKSFLWWVLSRYSVANDISLRLLSITWVVFGSSGDESGRLSESTSTWQVR